MTRPVETPKNERHSEIGDLRAVSLQDKVLEKQKDK
jgi:hypothetical protein